MDTDELIVCDLCGKDDPEYTDTDIWVCAECCTENGFNTIRPEVNGFYRHTR